MCALATHATVLWRMCRLSSLKNLLVAYSISDSSELGYAQGMTYVSALLLLHMSEEVCVAEHFSFSGTSCTPRILKHIACWWLNIYIECLLDTTTPDEGLQARTPISIATVLSRQVLRDL